MSDKEEIRRYEMFELRFKDNEPTGSKVNVNLKGIFRVLAETV